MLVYAKTSRGCCIKSAKDEDGGYDILKKEHGTSIDIYEVREAKEDDIVYVKAMGGYVPKDRFCFCSKGDL